MVVIGLISVLSIYYFVEQNAVNNIEIERIANIEKDKLAKLLERDEDRLDKLEEDRLDNSSSKNFKYTTTDFYIEQFNKSPDYGNYVDVSSSYFTTAILGSRVEEVIGDYSHPRNGKLYEGLSYINKEINIRNSSYDYHLRAEMKFYLGDTDGAMNDVNKALSLDYQTYYLKIRSMIKYLKNDFGGAINDINTILNFYNRANKHTASGEWCKKNNYYLLTLYNIAKGDKQAAKKYFDLTVNSGLETACGYDSEFLQKQAQAQAVKKGESKRRIRTPAEIRVLSLQPYIN